MGEARRTRTKAHKTQIVARLMVEELRFNGAAVAQGRRAAGGDAAAGGHAVVVERSEVVSNVRLKSSLRLWPGTALGLKPSNDAGLRGLRSKVVTRRRFAVGAKRSCHRPFGGQSSADSVGLLSRCSVLA